MNEEKKTLTIIEQGGKYLIDTGGYNTHLAIDGKIFAKTNKLQFSQAPTKIEIGTDKNEPDFYTRTVDGKEEKIDAEDYNSRTKIMKEECFDEDDEYISLEHEYKYRKAMNGWSPTYRGWTEWVEYPFQIQHLPEVDNPCISSYRADQKLDNPLVNYRPSKRYIVIEAFNRMGIDVMAAPVCRTYDGIPGTLTREESTYSPTTDLYRVRYDDREIVGRDSFNRVEERLTLEKAIAAFERDVNSVISKYEQAFGLVNAKITEENGRKLADSLLRIERSARALPVYIKSRDDKDYLMRQIKEAKKLLGVDYEQ